MNKETQQENTETQASDLKSHTSENTQVSGLSPQPSEETPVSGFSPQPSNEDVLIRVEGVSKKFCRSLKKSLWYGMQDLGSELLGKRHGGNGELRSDEFWAVKDVSFELKRGECLGLIGRNGAGKTTLLKMLNGLIKPEKGRIEMNGRVGALIALGAGFNPILSGRENIYVNASVLGLSKKEIDSKLEEIIDFAEVEEFIDTPVQNYSSGMQVRLGFAIATALEPDVLLLDEVLAVGDVRFRTKCYNKIGQLLKRAAVIYVAHDMNQISRICNQVMLLKRGGVAYLGGAAQGVEKYMEDNRGNTEKTQGGCEVWLPGLKINNVYLEPSRLRCNENVHAFVEYSSCDSVQIGLLRCNLINTERLLIADYDSAVCKQKYEFFPGCNVLKVELGKLPLSKGIYTFNIAAFDESRKVSLFHAYDQPGITVDSSMVTTSIIEMGRTKC